MDTPHKPWFGIFLLFAGLLLAGCGIGRPQPTPLAKASATPIPMVSATVTPWPTATRPTMRPSPTGPAATFTKGPSRTPFLTYTPYASHTPTFPALPTIPPFSGSGSNQGDKPDSAALLALYQSSSQLADYFLGRFWDNYLADPQADDPLIDFLSDEAFQVQDALAYEFAHHYPDGLPRPEQLWETFPLVESGTDPLYPQYLDWLGPALIERLNRERTSLEGHANLEFDGYTLDSYQVELDQGPGPEWLLLAHWDKLGASTWLALDQQPDGSYQRLAAPLPPLFHRLHVESQDLLLEDITGDGVPDLLFIRQGFSGVWITVEYLAAQGSASGYQLLGQAALSDYFDFQYQVIRSDAAALPQLEIRQKHRLNWDCTWDTIHVVSWQGGAARTGRQESPTMDTPACDIARAVTKSEQLTPQVAIQSLERALAALDPADPQQAGMLSFAHYRLAILYADQGQPGPAQQHLESFITLYDGPEAFKTQRLEPLRDSPVDAIQLCSLMAQTTQERIPPAWQPYTFGVAADSLDWNLINYMDLVCPVEELLKSRVAKIRFDPQQSPEQALRAAGITVIDAESYPITGNPHPAWFVLTGREELFFALGYLPKFPGEWDWWLVEPLETSPQLPERVNQDLTTDGWAELLFHTPADICDLGSANLSKFLLVTSDGQGPEVYSGLLCLKTGLDPMDTLLADLDNNGMVDWVEAYIHENPRFALRFEGGWIELTGITNLAVPAIPGAPDREAEQPDFVPLAYTIDPSTARQALQAAQTALDPSDPFYPRNWQRLAYLIAVTYERQGLDEQAAAAFLDVALSKPQTLWSSLAALHLQQK